MFEIITSLMVIGFVAYVAMPLLKQPQAAQQYISEHDSRLSELLNQQNMLQNIIEDLEFDYETGKLSEEDYESLAAEHQKSQKEIDSRIKSISGASMQEITMELEKEIEQAKNKIAPEKALACPECKASVNPGDKFCASCGAKLE